MIKDDPIVPVQRSTVVASKVGLEATFLHEDVSMPDITVEEKEMELKNMKTSQRSSISFEVEGEGLIHVVKCRVHRPQPSKLPASLV